MAQFIASSTVEVQGHRGNRQHVPENSIASFLSTLQMGADTVELDLLLTKDLEVVVHHNYRLNPHLCVQNNGSEIVSTQLDAARVIHKQTSEDDNLIDTEMITDIPLISQLSLQELKMYDIGTKILTKFPDQTPVPKLTVPTLEELFTAVDEHYAREQEWERALHQRTGSALSTRPLMRYNLEIKREHDRPDEVPDVDVICKAVLDVVERCGVQSRVSYSSFDVAVLEELRRIGADIPLSFLYWHADCDNMLSPSAAAAAARGQAPDISAYTPSTHLQAAVKGALALNAVTVSPDHRLITCRDDVMYLQSQTKCRVVLWTVNEPADWAVLVGYGVDGLITDYPRDLLKYLYERESALSLPDGPISLNESISR